MGPNRQAEKGGGKPRTEADSLLGGAPAEEETDAEKPAAHLKAYEQKKKTGVLRRLSSMFKKTNKAVDEMPTPVVVEQVEETVGLDPHKASVHHYTNLCLVLLMVVAAGAAVWGVWYGVETLTSSSSSSSSSSSDDDDNDHHKHHDGSTDDNTVHWVNVDDADDGKRDTDKASHGADFLPSGGQNTDDEADVGFGARSRRDLRGLTTVSSVYATQKSRDRRWALPTDMAMAATPRAIEDNRQSYGWQVWESASDRQSRRDRARTAKAELAGK